VLPLPFTHITSHRRATVKDEKEKGCVLFYDITPEFSEQSDRKHQKSQDIQTPSEYKQKL
jgi:hypothetical protein